MLEVLSTIGLTASASLVIGCLSLTRWPRRCAGWLSVRWAFSSPGSCSCSRSAPGGRARSRLRVRRSRSGTNGRVAGRCAGLAPFFASGPIMRTAVFGRPPLPAGRGRGDGYTNSLRRHVRGF